jgi:hypothetical protein
VRQREVRGRRVAEGHPAGRFSGPGISIITAKAFAEKRAFGRSGFPFMSREYTSLAIHSLSSATDMTFKILLIEPEKGSILDKTFHERNVDAV